MKIEQLEAVLEMAVKAGAIRSYSREKSDDAAHFCRNFYIVGNLNDHYTIEWYTNMMALKSRTMELWCDDVCLSNTHPSYDVALAFYYGSRQPVAHIGEKYEHLKARPEESMDGWIYWAGVNNPVPGKKVMFKLRFGYESKSPALSDDLRWEIVDDAYATDIIAYRVMEE
ncbi:hypothetical protein [Escherichia phage EC150]|uniref:Uncharacterized protein n=1 Tax=Escherichia phage EC150 TaxID=2936907 RepID=A0A9E7LKD0_9CAUD|nr:hypothetical protein [Escherichia phage EC150]